MRFKFAAILAIVVPAVLTGCSGGGGGSSSTQPPPPTPTPTPTLSSISITPIGPAMNPGGSVTLKATGHYSDGNSKDLTSLAKWSSDTPTVATANAGTVTGVSLGVATIS